MALASKHFSPMPMVAAPCALSAVMHCIIGSALQFGSMRKSKLKEPRKMKSLEPVAEEMQVDSFGHGQTTPYPFPTIHLQRAGGYFELEMFAEADRELRALPDTDPWVKRKRLFRWQSDSNLKIG